jgi:nucleoside-diphosphate-sugar epimerase
MKYLITGGCGFLGSNIASEIPKMSMESILVTKNIFDRYKGASCPS